METNRFSLTHQKIYRLSRPHDKLLTRTFCLLIFIIMFTPAGAQINFLTEYLLDRDIVEVPFDYKDHQIIVHGQVDDREGLVFLLDTGASSPVLNKSLGVNGTHIKDTVIQEAEGITPAESVWLSDLRLGEKENSVHVHNIAVLIADLSRMEKFLGHRIDGIVGITFLAGYVTNIDYTGHLLHFSKELSKSEASRHADEQKLFSFGLTDTNPLKVSSCVLLAGQLHTKYDYYFLLDTGFGGYLSVAQSAGLEAGLFKPDTPRIPTTNYSVSRIFQSNKIRANYLMLGSINLSNKVISIDYRNNDAYGQTGIVGNRFLQNYRVTLDYPHRKLWLERATEHDELDDAEKPSLGISVRADGHTIKVERVQANSPAQQSGIRAGDTIISIDGKEIDPEHTASALNMLAIPGKSITLGIKQGADPNFGTSAGLHTVSLKPSSPLDWKAAVSEQDIKHS